MKRIVVLALCVLAVGGTLHASHPEETQRIADIVLAAAVKAWESVETNPMPVVLGLGTFLLTVVYYKAKGKSLRECVEVAATRVTVIPMSAPPAEDAEIPVLKRAKARAVRTQLLADRILLQSRLRKWPEELTRVEKETCYTEQAVAETQRVLAERKKVNDEAVAKLKELRKEKSQAEAELAEIEAELNKLAEIV